MIALNDYVIVDPITRVDDLNEALTKLEIQTEEGSPHKGVVVAKGDKCELEIAVGDTIVFDELHPRGFKHGDQGYLFIKSEFVIAKLEGEQKK